MLIYSKTGSEQYPPKITYGEFPFRFSYEIDGEIYEIEDVVVCEYKYMDTYLRTVRTWKSELKSGIEGISILRYENANSILKPKRVNAVSAIYLDYGRAEYYMGDKENTRQQCKTERIC